MIHIMKNSKYKTTMSGISDILLLKKKAYNPTTITDIIILSKSLFRVSPLAKETSTKRGINFVDSISWSY